MCVVSVHSGFALYLSFKVHRVWCYMSRLQGIRVPFSFTSMFFSRQMFYFPISLSQHFTASRDLYRVQVWGSIKARNGDPLFTYATLLRSQTCTVSIFVPWKTRLDDSTWRTLMSFILVSFPGVTAEEGTFPLLLAGVVSHLQLYFPCNLLLLFFLK